MTLQLLLLFLDVFQHNEVHVNELINIHLIVSYQGFLVAINNTDYRYWM